jgi:hypothetical protein
MIGARYSRKCEGCVSFLACPLALIIVSDIVVGLSGQGDGCSWTGDADGTLSAFLLSEKQVGSWMTSWLGQLAV